MELRQLTYFIAVAEELHFGRAAARAGIAQPSLTQQIQRLERELGVLLLDRDSHTVEMTPAGRLFLNHARATIRRAGDAAAAVRPWGPGGGPVAAGGTVRIGCTRPAALWLLPGVLRRYLTEQPRAQVKLAEQWSGRQLAALLSGELDVGFVFGPVGYPQLRARVLHHEPFAVLLPAGHPLAGRSPLRFPEVACEPLVWFPRELSPAIYDRFSSAAAEANVPMNIRHQAQDVRAMRLLVEAGHAVGVVTATCAAAIADPGIVTRPLAGPPGREELSLVWRAGEPRRPVGAFLRIVAASLPPVPPGVN